jgi:ketosteroid isomerase-like protein
MKNLNITAIISFLFLFSCNEKEGKVKNANDELKTIEQTIHSTIGWAKNKDIKLLYNIIANDSNFLEVSPEGRVTKGFEYFKKNEAFWMNPEFKAIRYEIKDLKITVSKSGDVAWWYCI